MLVKVYGVAPEGGVSSDKRYSPADLHRRIHKRNVSKASPDPKHVSDVVMWSASNL